MIPIPNPGHIQSHTVVDSWASCVTNVPMIESRRNSIEAGPVALLLGGLPRVDKHVKKMVLPPDPANSRHPPRIRKGGSIFEEPTGNVRRRKLGNYRFPLLPQDTCIFLLLPPPLPPVLPRVYPGIFRMNHRSAYLGPSTLALLGPGCELLSEGGSVWDLRVKPDST